MENANLNYRLSYTFSKKISEKHIHFSSLQANSPLLSYKQLELIQKSVNTIKAFYESKKSDLDLEFKFEGDNLYIKQVRPYR